MIHGISGRKRQDFDHPCQFDGNLFRLQLSFKRYQNKSIHKMGKLKSNAQQIAELDDRVAKGILYFILAIIVEFC